MFEISLRYVTVANVRVACGITTSFISDLDMQELLEYMEFEIEQFINTRFVPYTTLEHYEGTDSERLVLRNNPVLKIRAIKIDDTDIDIDDVRYEPESGLVWLTSEADKSNFSTKTTERLTTRVKYDYGLLEHTATQTTTSGDETEGDAVVVAVADASSFTATDYIEIKGMDSMVEVVKISSIASNDITVDNLATSHESGSLVTLMRVPKAAERLMIIGCAMAAVARVVGQSFDEITGYSIGHIQIQKGEPYTQWREVNVQLQKEWANLIKHFQQRPAIF